MVLLGIFSAGLYSCVFSKKEKINYMETIFLLLTACIGIVLGSHILYVFINYKSISLTQPFYSIIQLFFSGSVFYGGLIGGVSITYIFRKKFIHYKKITAIATPAIPLFHFFGRIGCFLYGCCYGTKYSFGFIFNSSPVEIANGETRLPIQLIEAVFNFMLFVLLHKLKDKKLLIHHLLYYYILFYSIGRFFLEFLRGDEYRGKICGISTSQLISVFLIIFIGNILYRKKRRNNEDCEKVIENSER